MRAYSFRIQSDAEFNQNSTRGKFNRVMSSLRTSIRASSIRPVVSLEEAPSLVPVAAKQAAKPARMAAATLMQKPLRLLEDVRDGAETDKAGFIPYGNFAIQTCGTKSGDWFANIRFAVGKSMAGARCGIVAYKTEIYASKSLAVADAQIWIDESVSCMAA